MSLIINQSHPVHAVVEIRRPERDAAGALTYETVSRVVCSGTLHESTQNDIDRYGGTGRAIADMKRFVTRSFPGDDNSLVEIDGVVYDVSATPRRYRNSPMTSRDVVMLSAQTQERVWNDGQGI